MQPRPKSPDGSEDHHQQQQQKRSLRTATPWPLPPPRDIYTAPARTLGQPMDAEQYYEHILEELLATHATGQGLRQEKGGDNDWGSEDDLLMEGTDGTMDTFLEAAGPTHPRPSGDVRTASMPSLPS